MSQIQALIFDGNSFTTQQARNWMQRHGYYPIKLVHRTSGNLLRYRIKEPEEGKQYRLISISPAGIRAVVEFSN